MSDFLTNLSQRVLGTASLVRPGAPSLFASQRVAADGFGGSESEIGSATPPGVEVSAESPGPAAPVRETIREHGADKGLHPFPSADSPEAPANAREPDPVPAQERLPARRTLLPPISEREELPQSPQVISDDPFVASRADQGQTFSEERSIGDAIPSRDLYSLPVQETSNRLKGPGEGGRKIAGTNKGNGEENVRHSRGASDRLIARTIERTISEKNERQTDRISPRRLVAVERMSEGRRERIEDFGPAPTPSFTEGSIPPIAESERMSAPEFPPDVPLSRGSRRAERSSSGRGTLLVPNHIPHSEGQEAGEEITIPFAPAERGERREGETVPSRTINVTIGRIEVRGAPERKVPPTPARKAAKKGTEPAPVMSLSDYLKRYNGSGG